MKAKLILTTIAAVLLVGCGKSGNSSNSAEAKPTEPVNEIDKPEPTTGNAEIAETVILTAIRQGKTEPDSVAGPATEIPNPSSTPSGEPRMVLGNDGALYLSWLETGPKRIAKLRFSTWNGDGWAPARTVASGEDWFVNWADFPSLCALADGSLAAHWLQKSSGGAYSYDVMLSLSLDGGRHWSKPVTPHRDGTHTEHGFVSIVPLDTRTFGVFWLDGRNTTALGGDMSLHFTTLGRDGTLGKEQVVDQRVCECCQTSAVVLANGDAFVVYRDRSQREVRDISSAILRKGRVTSSRTLHADRWIIDGCPVNGPATDRNQDTVVVAWYTHQIDHSEVRVRFSANSAKQFGETIRIDDGHPSGRVDVELIDSDTAVVSWLESKEGVGEIRWRVVNRYGFKQASRTLTRTWHGRASGFPQIEYFEDSLFFTWTDATKPTRVKTARLPSIHLNDLEPD